MQILIENAMKRKSSIKEALQRVSGWWKGSSKII